MWSEKLAIWTAWGWNIWFILGIITILTGHTQGREYAEFIWPLDIVLLILWISNIFNQIGDRWLACFSEFDPSDDIDDHGQQLVYIGPGWGRVMVCVDILAQRDYASTYARVNFTCGWRLDGCRWRRVGPIGTPTVSVYCDECRCGLNVLGIFKTILPIVQSSGVPGPRQLDETRPVETLT